MKNRSLTNGTIEVGHICTNIRKSDSIGELTIAKVTRLLAEAEEVALVLACWLFDAMYSHVFITLLDLRVNLYICKE